MNERRQWGRYNIPNPLTLSGVDVRGEEILESGLLVNISVRGALCRVEKYIPVGTKLKLRVAVLFGGEQRMLYDSEVIRVEEDEGAYLLALRFTSKPSFSSE